MKKWVYEFHEGNADMRPLLGGKGANLAEMISCRSYMRTISRMNSRKR